MIDRQPPQNIEAEESILSSLLCDPKAIDVFDMLDASDFYRPAHQAIYAAAKAVKSQAGVDVALLVTRLKEAGELDKIGGAAYIARLMDECPIAPSVEKYAESIRGNARMRDIITVASQIAQKAYAAQGDFAGVIDDAHAAILSVDVDSAGDSIVHVRDVANDEIDRLEELHRADSSVTGLSTGFVDLDRLTFGLQRSDLIIVAARPSMGKTALAVNIMAEMARCGHPVLKFSLEMSRAQLTHRMLAAEAKVYANKFRCPKMLTRDDFGQITAAADRLAARPVFFDDTPGIKYTEIRRRARRAKRQYGISAVFIDHLGLVSGDQRLSRDREVGLMTSAFKGMAKELDIPVVVLSQLNRRVEERNNKRPILSDLRDSGNIEQDADVVMFLYRDEYYNPDTTDAGIAEVNIAKHRNGPTGGLKLVWRKETMRFENMARQEAI